MTVKFSPELAKFKRPEMMIVCFSHGDNAEELITESVSSKTKAKKIAEKHDKNEHNNQGDIRIVHWSARDEFEKVLADEAAELLQNRTQGDSWDTEDQRRGDDYEFVEHQYLRGGPKD
jgi:hypothetical protein